MAPRVRLQMRYQIPGCVDRGGAAEARAIEEERAANGAEMRALRSLPLCREQFVAIPDGGCPRKVKGGR